MQEKYIPLWEMKRPYYWSNATWYDRENHIEYKSAEDFINSFGESDPDMNYVVRWDWGYFEQDDDKVLRTENKKAIFCITVVRQRKGFLTTHACPIEEKDEPIFRKFLEKRWEKVLENWSPIC